MNHIACKKSQKQSFFQNFRRARCSSSETTTARLTTFGTLASANGFLWTFRFFFLTAHSMTDLQNVM